jgi:uncharacterized membrane protein YtjA (UPF0391 family)
VLVWHGDCKHPGMLDWSVLFFALAVIAALFGFTGVAASAAVLAKILFYSLITLTALALLGGMLGGSLP